MSSNLVSLLLDDPNKLTFCAACLSLAAAEIAISVKQVMTGLGKLNVCGDPGLGVWAGCACL